MEQPNLFEAHIYDALETLVASLGGPKRVANQLWPQKGIEAGAKDLRNALNPDHRAKLDMFDLVALLKLGQQAGDHVAMHRLCDDAGYQHPEPSNTEQQIAELDKQLASTIERLNGLMGERERIAPGLKLAGNK